MYVGKLVYRRDDQVTTNAQTCRAPLGDDITRLSLLAFTSPLRLLPSSEASFCSSFIFVMESVHHVTTSSKVLFTKVRKMVPPMLEKFHKGLFSLSALDPNGRWLGHFQL
jgi:hypothetical protein